MALGKIKADTLEHSTAGSLDTSYVVNGSAKAFSLFDGASNAIRKSFNQSSLTDVGTGQYRQTYSSAMSDAFQAVSTNGHRDSDQYIGNRSSDNTTAHHQVNSFTRGGVTRADTNTAVAIVLGDLA
tara:strand:- start:348 stop:725 length:378 start_codon:yes stop_codon:yes gene_type:complete